MPIQIEEIEAVLKSRGYQVVHGTSRKRGFQLDNRLPIYLNLASKSGVTALIAHPESGVATWQDQVTGMQVSNDYFHSSNMRMFPARMHGGVKPITYGWGLTFTTTTALGMCLDRLDGREPAALRAIVVSNQFEIDTPLREGADIAVSAQRRIGHDQFRAALFRHWTHCAVTGLEERRLLRASHIKPWASSTPIEKTDPFNGLLLAPHLDAAFDAGLISFDEGGQLLISGEMSIQDAARMGLHSAMRLRNLAAEHLPYLAFHRQNVFIR